VNDYSQINNLIQTVTPIDILVNAAGIWLEGELETYTQSQIDAVIDTNLKGLIYSCRGAVPQMKRDRSGVIVNIISSAGLKSRSHETVYAASKWGARGFTDSLREELKESGVRIIGVYPGGMATEFFKKAGHSKDVSTWMDPNEVASVIITAIENDNTLTIDQLILNRKVSGGFESH
jgi:uncharacterized protein